MPRIPKPPELRQRRNKTSTRAVLAPEGEAQKIQAPPLPSGRAWSQMTRSWWGDVWASPMAPEFLKADVHGLFLLAQLVDEFWLEPSTPLAAEIRMQSQRFGLSPIDRRRLQWEVAKVTEAQQRRARQRPAQQGRIGEDPRQMLRRIK